MKNEQKSLVEKKSESSLVIAFATGLLPFVSVSDSAYISLITGLMILAALVFSSTIYSILRNILPKGIRLPAYFIITAGVISIINLLIRGFSKEIYDILGIYLPLASACVSVIGIGGGSAVSSDIVSTIQNATFEGTAAILVLFGVGSVREILGDGKWLFIPIPNFPTITIFKQPAGGFLVYSVAIALLSISLNAFAEKQSLLSQLENDDSEEEVANE